MISHRPDCCEQDITLISLLWAGYYADQPGWYLHLYPGRSGPCPPHPRHRGHRTEENPGTQLDVNINLCMYKSSELSIPISRYKKTPPLSSCTWTMMYAVMQHKILFTKRKDLLPFVKNKLTLYFSSVIIIRRIFRQGVLLSNRWKYKSRVCPAIPLCFIHHHNTADSQTSLSFNFCYKTADQ